MMVTPAQRLSSTFPLFLALALAVPACPADAPVEDTTDTTLVELPPSASVLVTDPETLDFGTWSVGEAQILDLELEAAGPDAVIVSAIGLRDGLGQYGTNLAATEVAAGAKRVLKVTFYATEEGVHEDALLLTTDAANGPVIEVPLVGVVSARSCRDDDNDLHGVGCAAGPDCRDDDPDVYAGAPELCNGEDDDCDNLYDEDFVGLGSTCEVGLGDCITTGKIVCADDGRSSYCDGVPGQGNPERCNGLDDDCDGVTDEDFPSKGGLCGVGTGACRVVDKWVCAEDQTELVCPVEALAPQVEACGDLIDNDCDGVTDEGTIEVCGDGVDNDCDDVTDESGSRWGEVFFARDWYDETVATYASAGDGTFEAPVILDFPGDNRFSVFAVGDFDGDRWLDLVVREIVTEGRTLCQVTSDCASGRTCADGVCRKRCNNDGDCTDFAFEECVDTRSHDITNDTYCLPPSPVYLARSSCTGDDGDGIELTELFVLEPADVIGPVVDVDANGHLDFVGLHGFRDGKDGFIWLNDGDGGFTQVSPAFDYGPLYGPGLYGHWHWGLTRTSKDLTGDGYVDLLGQSQTATGAAPTDLWLLENRGDGTFEDMVSLGPTIPLPANLTTVNDFDGDGDQDIVGGLDEDGQPGAAWMLLNLGGGGDWVDAYPVFDLAPTYTVGFEKPGLGEGTSYDFDGDRRPDILAAWVPEECGTFVHGCTDVLDSSHLCYQGACRKIGLIRNLTGAACEAGTSCVDGTCVAGCVAECDGRTCGDDGCGGSCGACEHGRRCVGGLCVVDCAPACDGRQCGDNGCGGTCGECAAGFACVDGSCTDDCVPDCAGKACGSDGCGGTCAVFAPPAVITFDDNPKTNVAAPTNVPPTRPGITIDPANPKSSLDLECQVLAPSYDLDPVEYRYQWLVDGVFNKTIGDTPHVPASATAAGERWVCRVRATDGIESSPVAEAAVTISED